MNSHHAPDSDDFACSLARLHNRDEYRVQKYHTDRPTSISAAIHWHSGRSVPLKRGSSTLLQMFAKLIDGSPPVSKNTFKKAIGITSMTSS
jgi:hypothetical protein